MNDAGMILDKLNSIGVSVRVNEGKLQMAPADLIPPEVVEAVKVNKTDLIACLLGNRTISSNVPKSLLTCIKGSGECHLRTDSTKHFECIFKAGGECPFCTEGIDFKRYHSQPLPPEGSSPPTDVEGILGMPIAEAVRIWQKRESPLIKVNPSLAVNIETLLNACHPNPQHIEIIRDWLNDDNQHPNKRISSNGEKDDS